MDWEGEREGRRKGRQREREGRQRGGGEGRRKGGEREREGRRKERERGGEGRRREGGRGEFGHFCGRMCKLVAHWHGLLDVPAKISLPNGRSYTPVVTPGTLAWLALHPS